ncbi:hypothetical protein HK102_011857, partial [Quaeritorhiza haematococci]
TALKLQKQGSLIIIPLLIGVNELTTTGTPAYRKFNGFSIPMPNVHTAHEPHRTVRETVKEMFEIQGVFIDPEELTDRLEDVVRRFATDIWPDFRSQWYNPSEIGPEAILRCLQCLEDYKESENAPGS